MLAGMNLNANYRQPVNRTRIEGFARGQPVKRNEDCKLSKKIANPSHSTLKDNISPPMSDDATHNDFQSQGEVANCQSSVQEFVEIEENDDQFESSVFENLT